MTVTTQQCNAQRSVPEGFERDLRNYSRSTGRDYRAYWSSQGGGAHGLWFIQVKEPGGEWQSINAVIDHEAATEDDPRPYRDLDHRAIADLFESDITNLFKTGDIEKDHVLMKAYRATIMDKVREAKKSRNSQLFADIAREARWDLRRVNRKIVDGHAHGRSNEIFPVS